jgi:hypothetical protein
VSPDLRIPTRLPDLVAAYPTVYKPWQPGEPEPPYEAEIDPDLQAEARFEGEMFEPHLGDDPAELWGGGGW